MARRIRSVLRACALLIAAPAIASPAGAAQFSEIAAGGRATCASTPGGELYCWGDGREGQLGRVTQITARVPAKVIGTYDSQQVTAGNDFACQIVQRGVQLGVTGVLACWGANATGQLGNGQEGRAQYPQELRSPSGFTRIDAGVGTACGLDGAGGAWCWGDDRVGQAGDGSVAQVVRSPMPVAGTGGLVDIAVGGQHVCAARGDGQLVCWGWTRNGRTAIPPEDPLIALPTAIAGVDDVVDVAAGFSHTCVVRRTGGGTVWCFGQNSRGQLGLGTPPEADGLVPQQVPGLTGITRVDAGALSTCAVGASGRVWCWGTGLQGKLGDGKRQDSRTPVQVANLTGVVRLSVGENHACALTSRGTPYCWGSNRYGQLGTGDRTGIGARAVTPALVVDRALGRATFVPRALQSFPTGTAGGSIELRDLIVRKTSSRYVCPRRATITISARGRTARRTVSTIARRSSTSCRVSGSYALPARTEGATRASYAVRGTHLRTATGALRAQRTG